MRRLPRIAWAILIAALLVRVAFVFATSHYFLAPDPADFSRYAVSIAHDGRLPQSALPQRGATAYRPPGYPAFLAATYAVSGDSVRTARLAQAVLGTLAVGLIGLIGLLLWDRRVALFAMAIAAVFPPLIVVGEAILSEALLLPLSLGAVASALLFRRDPARIGWAAAAGALAGLSILTRVNAAVMLVPLVLLVWTRRPWRSGPALRPPAAVVAAALLCVVPWTLRNAHVFHQFVPVSTQAGFTLGGTYNEIARHDKRFPGIWVEWFRVPRYRNAALAAPDEAEAGAEVGNQALDYAAERPGYVASVLWHNTARTFQLEGVPDYGRADAAGQGYLGTRVADLEMGALYLLLPFAFAGALTRRARRAPPALWLVPLLTIPVFAIVAYFRFRVTIDPFLVILAALALAGLGDAGRRTARAG